VRNPVGVERAHNIVAQFRNYRAHFIFQRGDFVGGSVFEVNCDRHGFVDLSSNLLLGDGVNLVVSSAHIKIGDEELSLLQYGAFEIALRHVKLNSLSIPKEDFAIVFTVALYEVNCLQSYQSGGQHAG
jgi:hypothetical protein